jgi:hypothetical protein
MKWTGLQLTTLAAILVPLWAMAGGWIGKGNPMPAGGACTYKEVTGHAKITKVMTANPDGYNCKDAVEVYFTFTPDDPAAVKSYLFPDKSDQDRPLTVGAGMNPSKSWVESKGLTVGSPHRCIRKELTQGTCAPVLFEFPEIDFSDWQETCF